ncbi:hypothetical protein [Persephonella sp.]
MPNAYINGLVAYESADYGGGFATYTPPSVDGDFDIRVVEDTNATTPGKRLYIYAGGVWHYVALT